MKDPLAKASSQAAAAQKQAAAAQQQAAAAQSAAASGGSGRSGGPVAPVAPGSTAPAGPKVITAPFSNRLHVLTNAGATNSTGVTVPSRTTLQLTDLVFENPQGDFGTVTITQAGNTLLSMALENFRDTDYHFVSPIVVKSGDTVAVTVTCNAVGKPPDAPAPTQCDTAVFVGGTTSKPAG